MIGATLGFVGVQSDPTTVQTSNAKLIMYGTLLTPVPSGGSLNITAPSEVIPSNGGVSSCIASGNKITVILSNSLAADAFEIHISSVMKTPQSTTPTSSFSLETRSGANVVLDSLYSNIQLVATEGSMQSKTLTPSSQVVGASTSLNIKFKPTHDLLAGGFIKVTFPKWNPLAPNPLEYLSGSIQCSTTQILSNTLSCSFSNSVLTVSGGIGNTIPGGSEVGFTVNGFRNPISTSVISGFQLLTQDSVGGNIDIDTATLQITTAATIQSAQIQVDPNENSDIAGIVQETNRMRLQFTSPVPLNTNCTIKITLPSQFSLSSISNVNVSGLFGQLQSVQFTKNPSDNSFSFTKCTSYTNNNAAAFVTIQSLKLPNYIKETSTFQISIRNSNNDIVAQVNNGITFTATTGTLTAPIITAVNPIILSSTGLQITITPVHTIDINSRLLITLPSTYGLGTSCVVKNLLNINPAASCSVQGQQLIINSLLSNVFIGGTSSTLQLQINDITLPQTTQTQNGYSFTLQIQDPGDANYYSVDKFTGSIPVTINFGSLTAVVTPGSLNAFETTTYKFEITPDHFIPQNGYIKIIYPSDILIPDSSFSQSQCSGFINFPTSPTCVINTNTREITINNGFRLSTSPPGGTKFTLTIPGIQNPVSLTQTATFKFYTFSSDGQIMDQKESGITVTMTQTALMKSVSITLGSYVNAATTKYTFQITATVPVTENHIVIIYFPPQIVLPTQQSGLSCQSDDTLIFNAISCTFNTQESGTNSIRAALDLRSNIAQINSLQTFKITVFGLKNPTSTKPTSNFNLKIIDKTTNGVINRAPDGVTIATNTPYTLTQSKIVANATGAGEPAKYTITIYPENDIQVDGGIYIVYPSQVGLYLSTITATVTSSYTKSDPIVSFDKSARQILIRKAFQLKVAGATKDDTITIVLQGFKNPLTNTASSSFVVKTFNEEVNSGVSSFYYIDQVTDGLVLNSLCDYPCATCLTGQPSNCTSCYPTNTLNKLQGGACVAECSTGNYYNTKNSQCEACSYPCLGCSVKDTNCTLCGFQDYLFLFNNTCRNDCPASFVTDSSKNLCQKCSSECKTCDLTPQTCTSCTAGSAFPLLYQSTCLKTCPVNVSVQVNNICQSCDTSCKTCSGTVSTCTSCESYMRFDPVQKSCISVCQQGTQIYDQNKGICQQCDGNCGTCSGTVKTCTSCSNGQVLNTDNTCQDKCNSTDQTPVNSICKQCELPCSQCKGSVNHCTKCQGDYLLFNTTCVQYCPDKFEPNNVTRQCILVGLICPAGFTVNEAGDGCIPNEFECPEGQIINSQRTACVPAPGSPVPFPFIFFSIMLSLLVLGSFIKDRFFTKVYSNLIALFSLQEMLMYLLILAYSGANEVWGAFALSFIAILTQMSANIMFYLLYKRDVLKDEVFAKWQRSFPRTSKYIPLLALFINYKTIRFFYSGFYGLESCLAQFEDPKKNLFQPLKMITYFNLIFVYIPIFIADIIIFAQVKWGYQLLVLGIETFLITIAIIIFIYLESKIPPEKLIHTGDEQYTRIKPKSFGNDTMVMGGMIDVDESTLIRSKVVDDDYEVFLRKKAFVSILNQVGKNYFTAQEKGVDLGGKIDKVMTKFDEKRLKLRRAFSLEEIKEEDSWYIASDEGDKKKGFTKQDSESEDEYDKPRRYSYPLLPGADVVVPDPHFKNTLQEIKVAVKEQLVNNVYAECRAPDRNKEKNKRKTVSRRTQTYLRELLQMEGQDLQDSDLEIILEDEAEIDFDYAQGLIDGVIDGISESESNVGGGRGKKSKKKRKNLNAKRTKEIPDFELADIMGDFEIDDLGNFIILRGEKGELLDKKERRVNRRGYLVDRFGNIINKSGQVIFKAVELDSDDEIPAPFGFEKRKKNLLNLGQDGEFKVEGGQDKNLDDDEDLIDKELRKMKKQKKRRRQLPDGQIVEEEGDNDDDDDESSVDSLMAESPGKYQLDQLGQNEDEIIANVTRKKVPVKRGPARGAGKRTSPQRAGFGDHSPSESSRRKTGPLQNLPPKRIKRDDTKEMFPSLAIEASEQKKLFKIAEQIGGMANQIAENTKKLMDTSQISQQQQNQEKLEKLKQEHFKDIMSQSQQKQTINQSDKKLPPRPNIEKIYGNLGDVVTYEEQLLKEQYKGLRAQSPFSSQITSRMGAMRPESSVMGGDKRRLRGLESIYLQKFDKKAGLPGAKKPQKAKFRNTLQQFVDDPELLLDDGVDRQRQNDMSIMVADKLDRLQKQYMSNTATNKFANIASSTSIGGFQPTVGAAVIRKNGSLSGSLFNHDPSLEPIKKGNWVQRD